MTDEYLTGPKGTYRLLQRIGSGGMGIVHLALDEDGRTLAVKELHPSLIDDDMLSRLEREVTSMHRVSSPYVAEIRDADTRGTRPFVATRYVQGRPLDRTIRERGPLEGAQLVHVARHLATALQAIHDAGIIHRDLKPSNVMLSEGDPVVIDFGIAQAIDATRLTHTGVVVGTPGYVAPEIVNGGEAEQPSDVFAWAATIAYAATGRSPFGTGPAEVVFFRVVGGQSDLHGVPEALMPVLRAALTRDPAARPTAGELAERLAALELEPEAESAAAAEVPETSDNGAVEETGDLPAAGELATEPAHGGGPPPDRLDTQGSAAWSPPAPARAPAPDQVPGGPPAQWGAPPPHPGQAPPGHPGQAPPGQPGPGHPSQPQPSPMAPGQPQPGQAPAAQAHATPSQAPYGQGQYGPGQSAPAQAAQAQPGQAQPGQAQAGQAQAGQAQAGPVQAGPVQPGQAQPGAAGQVQPGPAAHPGQPQAAYGATLPAGSATTQGGAAPKLGLGLAALVIAGITGLTYALPVFGVLIAVAGLVWLGVRDRIRPYGAQSTGNALVAAAWRTAVAFVVAGVVAWALESGAEVVARPWVLAGPLDGMQQTPATTILSVFVALTVLLATAVPRWRSPARALAVLVRGSGNAAPLLRYGLIAVSVLAIIAALFVPDPAWFPLPLNTGMTLRGVYALQGW